jgi:hypothetical protein
MLAPWVVDEMRDADLKDDRLNQRLRKLLADLGERPTASIPAACGGRNEMVAAYRFFDNDGVTPERILEPHYARTRERMAEQEVVLLVQDTTELDFTRPQQQVKGAGPMDGANRRGAFLHPLEAFTSDGTPLGTVWAKMWTRDDSPPRDETASQKSARQKATPIEEKESIRWLEGLRQSRAVAQELPGTQCVCVADSEADIFEVLAEPRGERPVDWVIRLCHDRMLQPDVNAETSTDRCILEVVRQMPVLFTQEIHVRGRREPKIGCDTRGRRQPREARRTEVEVRTATVTLRPPRRPDRQLPEVTANIVWVRELHPPEGDVPVEWLLVTTLPVETREEVQTVLQYYTVRFLIEVLFRVLKSGCRVEERLFEHIDRLLPCVAVYLIVAWRTFLLCRMGHSCPDLNCEAVFEASEWKSVWMKVRGQMPPDEPPPLLQILKLVAQLGGYVNYANRKDPPGPQTIWLGIQRMQDLAWGWETFGPGARQQSCTANTETTCV